MPKNILDILESLHAGSSEEGLIRLLGEELVEPLVLAGLEDAVEEVACQAGSPQRDACSDQKALGGCRNTDTEVPAQRMIDSNSGNGRMKVSGTLQADLQCRSQNAVLRKLLEKYQAIDVREPFQLAMYEMPSTITRPTMSDEPHNFMVTAQSILTITCLA